ISILFLFIIMLLDIRFLELFNIFLNHFSIMTFLILILFFQLYLIFSFYFNDFLTSEFFNNNFTNYFFLYFRTNLQIFGEILYNHNFIYVYIVIYYLLLVL